MTNGLFSFAEGQVTGRGCSTKDKVFYKECETHSYGEQVEKMCFCSYFLCNASTPTVAPPSCLLLLIIGASLCCVLNQLQFNNCHINNNIRQKRNKTLQHKSTSSHHYRITNQDRTVICDTSLLHRCRSITSAVPVLHQMKS